MNRSQIMKGCVCCSKGLCGFFFFWLHCVFIAAHGLSLVAASRGYSSLRCAGFSLRWLLLLRSTGSRAQAQQLWHTGSVAPQHVVSSRTRARTHAPCIGRQILNHCATREALRVCILSKPLKIFHHRIGTHIYVYIFIYIYLFIHIYIHTYMCVYMYFIEM